MAPDPTPEGFRRDDRDANHAIDENSLVDTLTHGYGWVSGGEASVGVDDDFQLVIDPVTIFTGGEIHQIGVATRSLEAWYVGEKAADEERKLLICVSPSGVIEVYGGVAEPFEPGLEDSRVADPAEGGYFDTHRPAPPDLYDLEALDSSLSGPPIVLHEVCVPESALKLRSEHIDDRRRKSQVRVKDVYGHEVEAGKTLTLPSGTTVTKNTTLATSESIPTDAEILSIVAPAHFSGSHQDLTGLGASDHHSGPGTQGFIDAVRAEDASDLASGKAAVGQALYEDGWRDPAQQEAPVVAASTDTGRSALTLPGDQQSVPVTITGAFTGQGTQFSGAFGEAAGQVGIDHEWSVSDEPIRTYVAARNETDLTYVLTWESATLPGAGNDLDVSWTLFETLPAIVKGAWNTAKTLEAIVGEAIEPAAVRPTAASSVAIYDDLANYPAEYLGEGAEARTTGNDPSGNWVKGKYSYTGTEWDGPFGEGISTVSQLTIDADKDWNNKKIINLGEPTGSKHVTRLVDLNSATVPIEQDLAGHIQSPTAHQDTIAVESRRREIDTVDVDPGGGIGAGESSTIALRDSVPNGASLAVYHLRVAESDGQTPPATLITEFAVFDGLGGVNRVDDQGSSAGTNLLNSDPSTKAEKRSIDPFAPDTALAQLPHYTNTSGGPQHIGVIVDNGDQEPGTGIALGLSIDGHIEVVGP